MRQLLTILAAALLLGFTTADEPEVAYSRRAADLARTLAAACPAAGYGDQAAFQACSQALRTAVLPFASVVAWGGDQPEKRIDRKTLTHLNSQVFQTMYLPLFTFTGRWTLIEDQQTHTPIVRLEAYFRNTLASGNYPYPFWHSADKWAAYEAANEIRLYLGPRNQVFVATRSAAGNDSRRGPYAHAVTPAFEGRWEWQDAGGLQQPAVSLFSARYSETNPFLAGLDRTYRSFALRIRNESCLDCHTPANTAGAERLVLLQTPLHAAGEIDDVIRAVETSEMPQDDIGLRQEIPIASRTAVLQDATAFRDELARADDWEAAHRR
jgi:hypothetical protein